MYRTFVESTKILREQPIRTSSHVNVGRQLWTVQARVGNVYFS